MAYIGQTQFARGVWVGVVLDEAGACFATAALSAATASHSAAAAAVGLHDGTVHEKTYFRCAPSRGVFLKPIQLGPAQARAPPQHATMAVLTPALALCRTKTRSSRRKAASP